MSNQNNSKQSSSIHASDIDYKDKNTLDDWGIDDDDVSYILLAQRVEHIISRTSHISFEWSI